MFRKHSLRLPALFMAMLLLLSGSGAGLGFGICPHHDARTAHAAAGEVGAADASATHHAGHEALGSREELAGATSDHGPGHHGACTCLGSCQAPLSAPLLPALARTVWLPGPMLAVPAPAEATRLLPGAPAFLLPPSTAPPLFG